MCPACLGISTWLVAGGVTSGGAITIVVSRYMAKTRKPGKGCSELQPTPDNKDQDD